MCTYILYTFMRSYVYYIMYIMYARVLYIIYYVPSAIEQFNNNNDNVILREKRPRSLRHAQSITLLDERDGGCKHVTYIKQFIKRIYFLFLLLLFFRNSGRASVRCLVVASFSCDNITTQYRENAYIL